jgi:urease accessory protein
MHRDATEHRKGKPFLFAELRNGIGPQEIAEFIIREGGITLRDAAA